MILFKVSRILTIKQERKGSIMTADLSSSIRRNHNRSLIILVAAFRRKQTARRILSSLFLLCGLLSFAYAMLVAGANEEAYLNKLPWESNFSWVAVSLLCTLEAIIIWPHKGGLKKYFRELLGKE